MIAIPEYAYNQFTHNVQGLLDNLNRNKVIIKKEREAILRLSDYGRKDTQVWNIFTNTNWSKTGALGKYIIAALSGNQK